MTTHGGSPRLTPARRARLTRAQAFEDAIAYRRERLNVACPDCGPARCDEHATDLDLITWYQQGLRCALASASLAGR